jgi:hypothetical protein
VEDDKAIAFKLYELLREADMEVCGWGGGGGRHHQHSSNDMHSSSSGSGRTCVLDVHQVMMAW